MGIAPITRERLDPQPTHVWRPGPSVAIPQRQGLEKSDHPWPPLDALSLVYSELGGELEKHLEHLAALNARARQLLRLAAFTLGVLTLQVLFLSGLIIVRASIG